MLILTQKKMFWGVAFCNCVLAKVFYFASGNSSSHNAPLNGYLDTSRMHSTKFTAQSQPVVVFISKIEPCVSKDKHFLYNCWWLVSQFNFTWWFLTTWSERKSYEISMNWIQGEWIELKYYLEQSGVHLESV